MKKPAKRRKFVRTEPRGKRRVARARISEGGPQGDGADEILSEYDFSRAKRNKYAARYAVGSTVVVLDPDVASAFPTSFEANEALRALAGILQKRQSRRSGSHRTS